MESHITLLRVRGIPIGINWSWLFVAALLAWALGSVLFPSTHPGLDAPIYLAMAVAAVLLFFLSILAHELAHALVGLREGVRIEGITLWLLGGVARFTGGLPSPGTEFRMTIVGPLTSLALAGLFAALGSAAGGLGAPVPLRGVLEYLGRINLILAAFNLVPAMPLDGGRVLRAWLWHRQGDLFSATIAAAGAGRAFGFVLIWVGLLGFLTGSGIGGFWFVILGWFLLQAASAEARTATIQETFRGQRVRDLMTPNPATVSPGWSIAQLIEEAARPTGHSTYPVVEEGRLIGLVSVRAAARVPPEERHVHRVSDVMVPLGETPRVAPDAPVTDALHALQGGPGRVVVTEDERAVGMISLADVARAVEIERVRRPSPRPLPRPGIGARIVVAIAVAAAGGYLYHPPIAVLSPGPAIDVSRAITISGVPVQGINGRYLAVPVRVTRPNALEALYAAFDPNREVVALSALVPVGGDPQRVAEEQRRLFRESQVVAAAAAAQVVGMQPTLDGSGARVLDLIAGSPAEGQLQRGDIIVALDGTPVRTAFDVRAIVASRPAGSTFTVAVEREGIRLEVRVRSVQLGRGGDAPPALGALVDTRGLDVRLPFEIRFRDLPVGGPSAGLAYALAIVDMLDDDDIARGRTIAATGTVDVLGDVGPVAGLPAKAEAARREDADLFLVPAHVLEAVPAGETEVRGVTTLGQAIAILRTQV